MKRTSFGKLAIVVLLSVAMLFGLCVCSKKADTPAATTTTTTTTKTETPVASQPEVVAPVEVVDTTPVVAEPEVVETPVVSEPEVVEAPVEVPEAPVVVEAVVETEEEPVSLFSTIFTYKGITSNVTAYADKAVVSIPEGVTLADITSIASALLSAYPEAAVVEYTVDGANLVLTYPAQSEVFIQSAVALLENEAVALIDSLTVKTEVAVAEVVEEAPAEEEPVSLFSTIFTYKGITSNVTAYADKAVLSIPEGVTLADITSIASALLSAYPEAALVQYSVDGNNLVLTYPAQSEAFIQSAVALLENEAVALIDSLTAKAEVAVAEVVEEEKDTILAEGVVLKEDGSVVADYNYHNLASAKVVVSDTKTTVTYPAEYIYNSDIDYFFASLAQLYPNIAEFVEYSIPEAGTLVVTYPEDILGGTYYKLQTLAYLNDAVTSYADAVLSDLLAPKAEVAVAEVVEEAPAEEEPVSLFSTIFTYKGITSNVTAYADKAVVSIPEGVTLADITSIASALLSAYPEAALVQYSVDGNNLVLTYPAQSEAFVQSAVALLENEAVALIDSLTAKTEVAVAEVVEEAPAPAPVVAEPAPAPVVTPAPAPVAPVVAEPTPAPVVTPAPAPVAPVVVEPAPVVPVVAAPKASALDNFSATAYFALSLGKAPVNLGGGVELTYALTEDFSLGAMAEFTSPKNLNALMVARYNIASFANFTAFGYAGAGVAVANNTPSLLLDAGLGLDYKITENLALTAKAGARLTTDFNTANVRFAGSVGVKVSF